MQENYLFQIVVFWLNRKHRIPSNKRYANQTVPLEFVDARKMVNKFIPLFNVDV